MRLAQNCAGTEGKAAAVFKGVAEADYRGFLLFLNRKLSSWLMALEQRSAWLSSMLFPGLLTFQLGRRKNDAEPFSLHLVFDLGRQALPRLTSLHFITQTRPRDHLGPGERFPSLL